MFVLSKVSDTIRVEPVAFAKPILESLENSINRKYANKVIHNVGLGICLFDIESVGDGLTKPGDGDVFVKTCFRLLVFRPFIGEILVGWISSCSEEGLNVKMEFFDDIRIPKSLLFESCEYNSAENAWVWKIPDNDFYLDVNEKIRFRVEREFFSQQHASNEGSFADEPYLIFGSCQTDGLGLLSWWD